MEEQLTQLRQDLESLKSCIAERKDARQNWLEQSMRSANSCNRSDQTEQPRPANSYNSNKTNQQRTSKAVRH